MRQMRRTAYLKSALLPSYLFSLAVVIIGLEQQGSLSVLFICETEFSLISSFRSLNHLPIFFSVFILPSSRITDISAFRIAETQKGEELLSILSPLCISTFALVDSTYVRHQFIPSHITNGNSRHQPNYAISPYLLHTSQASPERFAGRRVSRSNISHLHAQPLPRHSLPELSYHILDQVFA